MCFISTEYDSLSHTVCTFQIVGYFLSNFPMTVFYHYIIVVIAIVVNTIFYFIAVNILLTFDRSPLIANIGCNIDNFEWGKKSVFYTVLQAICIDWLTKITDT